jgi:hypothetical protein
LLCPDLNRRLLNDKPLDVLAIERRDRGVNDVVQFRDRQIRLQYQIMRPAQGKEAAFNGQPAFLQALGGAQALRGNCMHCGQRVLHAMMQFLQQQTLQSFGDLVFCRINSRLSQEACCIDFCLRHQLAETRDFRLKDFFFMTFVVRRHNWSRVRT